MKQQQKIFLFLLAAVGLLVLPLVLQTFGNAWVRIADMALLFVLLSLGLNIVVGYAGLLDLGYVAFLRLRLCSLTGYTCRCGSFSRLLLR